MKNCNKCRVEYQVDRLEHDLEEFKDGNSNTHRDLYTKVNACTAYKDLSIERFETTTRKLDNMDAELKDLKARPARRWEAAVSAIITAVVGLVLGFVFGNAT